VAFKIRQTAFPATAPPRTLLGNSRRSHIPHSQLQRAHPSTYSTRRLGLRGGIVRPKYFPLEPLGLGRAQGSMYWTGPKSPYKGQLSGGRTCPSMLNDTLPWAAQKMAELIELPFVQALSHNTPTRHTALRISQTATTSLGWKKNRSAL